MKKLKYGMIHCSATPEGRDVQPEDIIRMHTAAPPVGRGWKVVGYSKFITLDGTTHKLRNANEDQWVQPEEITNGAEGFNSVTRHICYAGGVSKDGKKPKDTRTQSQKIALEAEIKNMIKIHPDIVILGHYQVQPNKACPSFNVPLWLKSIGIADKNIYKG